MSIGKALIKEYKCRSKVGVWFYPAELELMVKYFEGNYLYLQQSGVILYEYALQEKKKENLFESFRCVGLAMNSLSMLEKLDPEGEYLTDRINYGAERRRITQLRNKLRVRLEFPQIGRKIIRRYVNLGKRRDKGSYEYKKREAELDELIEKLREK